MSSETTPQPRRRKSRSDLVHLRSLPSTQPATKIGQLNWAWAEIEAALAVGMKLKEIWEAVGRDGLEMSYAQFRVYISRLRRRRQQFKAPETLPPPPVATNHEDGLQAPPFDPFRNLREQREKRNSPCSSTTRFRLTKTQRDRPRSAEDISFSRRCQAGRWCRLLQRQKICPEVPPPFPYKLGSKILSMSTKATALTRRRKLRSDLVHLRFLPSTHPAPSSNPFRNLRDPWEKKKQCEFEVR
jgi:hypothetical protein